ncbi:MAG TPA: hypothetical protein P5052_02095 [Candidatus Paceibacterota bacterium]|jgi:hypothetical protein|nr:hypothetical protein [Candidatus Paceibacterota bacterium]HRZ29542.1 hypothetical protein [Candidatus Paceibacterota bacterium]
MSKYSIDQKNATQMAKILSRNIWPSKDVLSVTHSTHPETGQSHVIIESDKPLEKVEREIKKILFLHGKIIEPLQLTPIEIK